MNSAAICNIIGVAANLVGVIILFLFGMPFRVRTGGNQVIFTTSNRNEEIVRTEFWYTVLGWIGLGLIVLGSIFQVRASLL